VIVKGKYFCSF